MEFRPVDSDSKRGFRTQNIGIKAMLARRALADFVHTHSVTAKGKIRTRSVRRYNPNIALPHEVARLTLQDAHDAAKAALDSDNPEELLRVFEALHFYR